MWYFLSINHMPIVFSSHLCMTWGKWQYYDYTLFEVFSDDWRVVASGQSLLHPLNESIDKNVILIAKFNLNKPLMDNGLHQPTQFEWVTNAD